MIQAKNVRISLDRREPGSDIDFISHAHTDHLGAVRSSKSILASEQTIDLIEHAQNIAIHNKSDYDRFRMLEAGHMLGSRQLCIEDCNGIRVTYTGDFQMVRSKTSRPIEIVDTDVLIIDSTYSDSLVRFDDKYETESALQDWTASKLKNGIVIFSAYAMGKAQELISIFNEIGIKPLVSRKISRVSQVYRDNGIDLEYSSAYTSDDCYNSLIRDNFVGITDSRDLGFLKRGLEMAHNKRVYTAVATGFAKIFRFNTSAQFPLSDHADFMQSVDYIESTGAREVLTYGPNAHSFAKNLRNKGYNSMPFAESSISRELADKTYRCYGDNNRIQ